jgi:hypothetical protein
MYFPSDRDFLPLYISVVIVILSIISLIGQQMKLKSCDDKTLKENEICRDVPYQYLFSQIAFVIIIYLSCYFNHTNIAYFILFLPVLFMIFIIIALASIFRKIN